MISKVEKRKNSETCKQCKLVPAEVWIIRYNSGKYSKELHVCPACNEIIKITEKELTGQEDLTLAN